MIASREVTHPAFPEAVVRTPAVAVLDIADSSTYENECFGPVAYLIKAGSTAESVDTFRRTAIERGAMTASVYPRAKT